MPHELWRQDDNGNRVRVATYATRDAAQAAQAAYEARGHKQLYWVVAAADQDADEARSVDTTLASAATIPRP